MLDWKLLSIKNAKKRRKELLTKAWHEKFTRVGEVNYSKRLITNTN